MKPIILDLDKTTDSVVMYDSRPTNGINYFIYVVLCAIAAALLWMTWFKIDIVVKSNGVIKQNEYIHSVSSETTGVLDHYLYSDGDYVNKGDVIAILKNDTLSDTVSGLKEKIVTLEQHASILQGYTEYLDGNKEKLTEYRNNPFYNEIKVKADLLDAVITNNESISENKDNVYATNIDNLNKNISEYNNRIQKLEFSKNCIYSRSNGFSAAEDSLYSSIINSYIDNYYSTELTYDNKIFELDSQIRQLENQLTFSGSDTAKEVKEQITDMINSKNNIISEKNSALTSIETQQISSIEQQIDSAKEGKTSAEASLASLNAEKTAEKITASPESQQLSIMNEKNSVTAELSEINAQLQSYKSELSGYNLQEEKCELRANESGIINIIPSFQPGTLVEQGTILANIYPENNDTYFAEVYVQNDDIGKIKEGQQVTFEISSYPSDEFGYFTGTVEKISKDIQVNESTGESFYITKVVCNDRKLLDNENNIALMNGMACQANMITDRQSVLRYLLNKIDLIG